MSTTATSGRRMSFFDEADEPRTARRPAPRSRRPSGSGRRRPPGRQTIVERRAVAAVAIVIVVVLVALGVQSWQVSQRNSALTDYESHVAAMIGQSNQTGSQFFGELAPGGGAFNATDLQKQINQVAAAVFAEHS
jgi:hypothetical protein